MRRTFALFALLVACKGTAIPTTDAGEVCGNLRSLGCAEASDMAGCRYALESDGRLTIEQSACLRAATSKDAVQACFIAYVPCR